MGSITASIVVSIESFESVYQYYWLDSKMSSFLQGYTPLQPYLSLRYVIQELCGDVKSIVLKYPNDQTIRLRIINEKHAR